MPFNRFSSDKFAKVTKFGTGLRQNRPALEKIAIRSFLDLRKAVVDNKLLDAGVRPDDVKEFTSFASLAHVFPSHVAIALLDQGANSPAELVRWDEDKFAKALGAAGVGKVQSATEGERFARFRELASTSRHPESVTGLQIDLGEDYALLGRNASELKTQGVETIADWAHLRSGLKVDSGTRHLLDSYARLSVLGLAPKAVKHLLDHKIDSAVSLAHQTDSELQTIAKTGGIEATVLLKARQLAIELRERLILDFDFHRDWEVPDPIWPRPCIVCPENESVFSKFAYYLYLIEKTGKDFHELEITLFQDFSRMTPADGEEVVPQPAVCNEVLQTKLGRNLTQDERLPEWRYRGLSTLRKVVPRSPAQIVSFWNAREPVPFPADLLPRLIAAYGAPPPVTDEEMLNPQPVFTLAEVDNLGLAGEAIMTQEIQSDPRFVGATLQEVLDELERRIAVRAQDEIEFTRLIHRAALKKALNRTDRELFALLFIETDRPLCEQTTHLDQAIVTLQAYLTENGTSTPRYLSFPSWRGEVLGTKYPETALLLRDDVLVGDTGTWDRGSILRNHSIQYDELKSQLSIVRRAIDDARVHINNSLDLNPAKWNTLSKFKDDPYYEHFQRGLSVLDDILDANDRVYRAASDLDKEEPGIALGRLQAAVSLLDRVDGELFDNHWFWANQLSAAKRYAELIKMSPAIRKESLENQFFSFVQAPKKIFELRQSNPAVAGLTDLTVLQVGNPNWSASPEFEQGEGYIVRDRAERADTFSEFRYTQGRNLENYTFSCEFRARSYWQWPTGLLDRLLKLGIGLRLQDGSQDGYRLAVVGSWTESGRVMDILALQVVRNGAVTTLSEQEIGRDSFTEIEGRCITIDHWYALSLTVSGGVLSGWLRITPETQIDLGPVQDAHFNKGSISIFVQSSAEVEFRNLTFRNEVLTGAPPFFAGRRVDLGSTLSDGHYWLHLQEAWPMSLELVTEPLAVSIDTSKKQRLAGVKRDGNDLYLTFPPGGSKVSLNGLDLLLERCLALTYYLRFAAIPVRMAQANLMMGEYQTASDLLHVLYDEEPDDRRERTMYPFFALRYYSSDADAGADAAAMRLRLGEVYLRWAEMRFRQNTQTSRYEARRLYERVLRLHRREDCDCVERQRGAATHVLSLARQARAPGGIAAAREVLRRDAFVRLNLISQTKNWSEVQELIHTEREAYRAKVKADGIPEKLRGKALNRIKAAELKIVDVRGMTGAAFTAPRQQSVASRSSRIASLSSIYLCTPDNPLESAQTSEACLMLSMLKHCVNILGYSDDLVPPLRFEALLRISESFANLAQAAERDVLQFRQQFEQEAFALMQAETNLDQANVEVAIEQLNVELAEGEITLSETQQEQAQAGVTHFESLVSEGMTDTEEDALAAADAAAQLGAAQAIFSFATMPAQLLLAGFTGKMDRMMGGPGQIIGEMGNAFSAQASALAMRASLERQQEDRELQLQQTRFGLSIAFQGVSLAFQRWEIAQLQEELGGLRRDFARDSLAFLNNKMLSAAGWLTLMKLAREQYRRRLSYAIETSYLAERALAFELQNPALKVIRFDYYDPRKDGLLGATQLLTDLADLQSRKVAFRQPKLQLSKTISLSALFPAAFEQFRQGPGVFTFSTLPEMFDRDFPGQYLRLIQAVRVTVVALVPPQEGIRAALRNSGISQSVAGPPYVPAFEMRTIRRNPETIALSSPFQATGLFVLEYKDDLLLPFEGSGVVTDWVFEMPKAANAFDYNTIADVLVTIEYTALDSSSLRNQVIQQMNPEVRAERAFSLRRQFPDQWYDLHHTSSSPRTITLEIERSDFPPNVGSNLRIQHLALYFARKEGISQEASIASVILAPQRPPSAAAAPPIRSGSDFSTTNGIVSSRQAGGAALSPFSPFLTAPASPLGKWEMSFSDAATIALFDEEESKLNDILLAITWTATAPPWPPA